MGRFDTTKATINANIKKNGNQEITGSILNSVMTEMVDATDAELAKLSEEHNDLNYEVNATPHVMIGKYSTTTAGNKLSFIDYAPRSSTRLIPRYSDKFAIVGVDSIYDIIFLDKDNIVTRRNGAIRTFNEGEVAMVVIFVNDNNPNGYSQLRVLQGVTLTENLESVYKEMDIRSVMSGDSIKNVVLNGYYNASGNFTSDDTYKALPLLPNNNNVLSIDFNTWKAITFNARCFDKDKNYIGDVISKDLEGGVRRYEAVPNTAYYGIYWIPKDTSTDYSKYFILGLQYPQLFSLLTSENEGGDENEKLSLIDIVGSVNLYNPNDADAIEGAYISGDYVESTASYDSSGYISVKENTVYYNAADSTRSFRFVNYYDEDKNFIAKESDSTGSYLNRFTTPLGCAYVRVSVYANYERTHFVAEKEVNYTPYSPQLGTDGKKVATIDEVGNTLYGKKWCVVGDSFSADFPKGYADDWYYDNGTSKVYGRLIAERNKMSLQWMAAGGRTIATPSDGSFTNAFSLDLYKNIDADVDYITIYLGINDSHHAPGSSGDDGEDKSGEIPLGTINDTTNATFYGAWNVVIPYLIEKHPFAHIGIIVSNGCDTEEYREAEKAIAKKYGIPYIDLNGDERTPCMIRSKNPNIPQSIRNLRTLAQAIDYDGSITGTPNSHPNKAAHEYESVFIENFLRSL
jgi:lysophospholipase L1-like esterase